ncbi:MAG: acyl-CoA reductase [Flavobacteriia bacterium]|nr:MAG: acyl-CoA reductase [Flavobacteriia bacterium]
MNLGKRITAFDTLGKFLSQFSRSAIERKEGIPENDLFFDVFNMKIKRAKEYNGWFTEDNILYAFKSWSEILKKENLEKWVSNYSFKEDPKTVAVIMAGNIPLVGFHDFLSVLISGNRIKAKQSSNDKHFIPLIAKYLEKIEPAFKGMISFTENKLEDFDAVIATGSNNTARYFEYYFGKYPNIIRRNRNAVAILTGDENDEDLKKLGEDIFLYFGLGCRSVAKIFVPKAYDFDRLFKNIYSYKDLIEYKKYENNYDYNKAVYLMSRFKLLENGFLMLKEDPSYSSPIATLFYEYYDDIEALKLKLQMERDQIQCVVSKLDLDNKVDFGKTQKPELWEYADGVDTLEFLQKI